jgi:hypothetical protein
MGDSIRAFRVLVERPERKRSLGRPRHRREDNMKTCVQELGWESLD